MGRIQVFCTASREESLPGLIDSPETSERSLCTNGSIPEPYLGQQWPLQNRQAKKDYKSCAWLFVIRTVAFIDFASTLLVNVANLEMSPKVDDKSFCEDSFAQRVSIFLRENRSQVTTLSDALGIIFSVLWFVDAIVKALAKRRHTERNRVLLSPKRQRKHLHAAAKRYYRSIVLQLLLLPVGFYSFLWFMICFVVDRNDQDRALLTNRSDLSLVVAVFKFCGETFKRRLELAQEVELKTFKWKSVRKLLVAAIRRPRTFRRRVLKLLTYVRWVQYLLPLVAATNKLRENFCDMMKKYQQRLASMHEQGVRRRRWRHMTKGQQRQAAATLVQAKYRSVRTRRFVKVLQRLKAQKEWRAVTTFQRIARGMLERARLRILKKRLELERLQEQEELTMSQEDRRRLYELQDELNAEAEALLNRKLLLRPNTTFAVVWKFMFVLCILFEIGQLVYKPRLDQFKDKMTKQPVGIGRILEEKLVPIPMDQWKQCQSLPPVKATPWRKWTNATESSEAILPWYCSYKPMHMAYTRAVRFLLTETLTIFSVICFLDVFVTFFTGELDPETGTLGPKPFFTRYILPGLLLQLTVNPQMVKTSAFLWKMLTCILHIGPIRMWRWTAVLFHPILRCSVHWIADKIWIPLVYEQNNNIR